MVFVHGGGFQFGSGSYYQGKYLMDEQVVYVSIQYRLGALGIVFSMKKCDAGGTCKVKHILISTKCRIFEHGR